MANSVTLLNPRSSVGSGIECKWIQFNRITSFTSVNSLLGAISFP